MKIEKGLNFSLISKLLPYQSVPFVIISFFRSLFTSLYSTCRDDGYGVIWTVAG